MSEVMPETMPMSRGVSDFTARNPDGGKETLPLRVISLMGMLGMYEIPEWFNELTAVVSTMPSADAIAEFFRGKGVKGKRTILEDCPIAAWAKGCGAQQVQVDNKGLQVYAGEDLGLVNLTSDPFKEFITNFDNGAYPFLEA